MSRLFEGSEDELVARLTALAAACGGARGALGIGDDAAVLPGAPVRVVTLDMLVEGQHFRRDLVGPEALADRALEVNLSDVAAMGARPTGVFLGIAWPADRASRRLGGRVLEAFVHAAAARGVPVLGGDTVRAASGSATLAVTAFGTPWPGGPVLRSGGRPGDVLAVTGPLGASAAGLLLLERRARVTGRSDRALAAAAVAAFRTPRARLDLARPLARHARALMDLSDGLGLDLPRLARASRCGFVVDAAAIPVHPAAVRFGGGVAGGLALALGGGEDYELLAACAPDAFAAARRAVRRAGGDLLPIGRLTRSRSQWLLNREKKRGEWPRTGWDPFGTGPKFGLDAGCLPVVGDGEHPRHDR